MGTSVCADISKYALKNQYVQFLYEKITQQKKSKKNVLSGFFHIKIERIGFWEHILRYQRTLMFPIFFPFWTAYLPCTETLFYVCKILQSIFPGESEGWGCCSHQLFFHLSSLQISNTAKTNRKPGNIICSPILSEESTILLFLYICQHFFWSESIVDWLDCRLIIFFL